MVLAKDDAQRIVKSARAALSWRERDLMDLQDTLDYLFEYAEERDRQARRIEELEGQIAELEDVIVEELE